MSAQELLYLAAGVALTAVVIGAFVLRETWLDHKYVVALGVTNGRLAIAKRELGAEVARTVALALYFVAAVSSAAGAESTGSLSPGRALGIISFGFGHLVLAVDSLRVFIIRRRRD